MSSSEFEITTGPGLLWRACNPEFGASDREIDKRLQGMIEEVPEYVRRGFDQIQLDDCRGIPHFLTDFHRVDGAPLLETYATLIRLSRKELLSGEHKPKLLRVGQLAAMKFATVAFEVVGAHMHKVAIGCALPISQTGHVLHTSYLDGELYPSVDVFQEPEHDGVTVRLIFDFGFSAE